MNKLVKQKICAMHLQHSSKKRHCGWIRHIQERVHDKPQRRCDRITRRREYPHSTPPDGTKRRRQVLVIATVNSSGVGCNLLEQPHDSTSDVGWRTLGTAISKNIEKNEQHEYCISSLYAYNRSVVPLRINVEVMTQETR